MAQVTKTSTHCGAGRPPHPAARSGSKDAVSHTDCTVHKFAQSRLTQIAEVKERTALSHHQLRITKIHSQLMIPDMPASRGRTSGRDLKNSGSQLPASPSIWFPGETLRPEIGRLSLRLQLLMIAKRAKDMQHAVQCGVDVARDYEKTFCTWITLAGRTFYAWESGAFVTRRSVQHTSSTSVRWVAR